MSEFNGFSNETNDILWGIRLNNHKEWFHQNKENYKKFVHEPILQFADSIFDFMKTIDNKFNEKPKISRVNRDIRFSKIKLPYKESKWFFLRADGSINIQYDNPTYFFEITPDWYRYGFFYCPSPKKMEKFRKRIDNNIEEFKAILKVFNSQDEFKIEGEKYKRNLSKNLPEDVAQWYQYKGINFVKYNNYEDNLFYEKELENVVFSGFKKLYPLYQYFNSIN